MQSEPVDRIRRAHVRGTESALALDSLILVLPRIATRVPLELPYRDTIGWLNVERIDHISHYFYTLCGRAEQRRQVGFRAAVV